MPKVPKKPHPVDEVPLINMIHGVPARELKPVEHIRTSHAGWLARQRSALSRARPMPAPMVATRAASHLFAGCRVDPARLLELTPEGTLLTLYGFTLAQDRWLQLLAEAPFAVIAWQTQDASTRASVETFCATALKAKAPVVVIRDMGDAIGKRRPKLRAPALYLDLDDDGDNVPVQLLLAPLFDGLKRWFDGDLGRALQGATALAYRSFPAADRPGALRSLARRVATKLPADAILVHIICDHICDHHLVLGDLWRVKARFRSVPVAVTCATDERAPGIAVFTATGSRPSRRRQGAP